MRAVIAVNGLGEQERSEIARYIDGWLAVDYLPEQTGDWETALSNAEVVFGWPPAEAVERSGVRFFQLPSSGYEQYMTQALTARPRFRMANSRGVAAIAVAEHCLAMMFALSRRVVLHARQQEQHVWRRASDYELLHGKAITIVGLGAIGRALGERCDALGMRVIAVRKSAEAPRFVAESYGLGELRTALGRANHVALTIASVPGRDPLFGADEFDAIARPGYFYNMARGSLVDEQALENALKAGHLAGAGLDVFAEEPLPQRNPLWDCEKVLISPHAGGRFAGEIRALNDLFLKNLQQYRAGKPMSNLVIDNP